MIFYSSLTGNTEYLARRLGEDLGLEVSELPGVFSLPGFFGLGSYTYGNGNIPVELKSWVLDRLEQFQGKRVFLFGSGNSSYPKFCGALDGLKTILEDSGATVCAILRFEHALYNPETGEIEKLKYETGAIKGKDNANN